MDERTGLGAGDGGASGSADAIRALTAGMRRLLVVASGLVLGTGLILTLLAERTDDYFAWTIKPPMTAAFLGAGYLASVGFQLVAAREREWAAARVAISATLVFTALTTLATFLHLDRFHHESSQPATLLVTWAWTAIYVAVPPVMAFLLVRQLRAPGGDPPRRAVFPLGFRLVLGLQSLVMLAVGAALFVAPLSSRGIWPWELTPLTGQAVGAWLLGLGVAGAHSLVENDWSRVRPTAVGNLGLGVFHTVALARFGGDLDWGEPAAWIYAAFIATMLLVGLYAYRQVRRSVAAAAPALAP